MSENKPPLIYEARNALEAGRTEIEKLELLAVLLGTDGNDLNGSERCTLGMLMADLLRQAGRQFEMVECALNGFIPDGQEGGDHEQN